MDRSLALPLIQEIYDAALEPAGWQGFVQSLSDAYGGSPTGFALQLPGFPLSGVFFTAGGFVEEYREQFALHSLRGLPWEDARRKNFVGRFGLGSEVISDAQVAESAFYRDWMAPQGLAAHAPIGHTIALDEGRPIAGLAIFASRERGAFREADLELGDLLVPHLARAYRIHTEARRHQALADAIDRFPTGLVLLDAQGRVLRTNVGAQQILERGDGIALEGDVLRAESSAEDAALHRMIENAAGAVSRGDAPHSEVLSIPRSSSVRPYTAMVAPLVPPGGEPTLADAVAVLYLADLEAGALRRREALHELYALTEAETQLVELLCQGSSLEEAAEARGVTINTARSQLKQVFSKTRTSRQSELVRLVLGSVTSISGP